LTKSECLSVPLTPVTLIAYLPRGVKVVVAIVSFAEVSVFPDVRTTLVLFRVEVIPRTTELLAERLTVPLKLFRLVRMIVTFLLAPCRTEKLVMFAPILKFDDVTVIVKLSLMELLVRELSTISRFGL